MFTFATKFWSRYPQPIEAIAKGWRLNVFSEEQRVNYYQIQIDWFDESTISAYTKKSLLEKLNPIISPTWTSKPRSYDTQSSPLSTRPTKRMLIIPTQKAFKIFQYAEIKMFTESAVIFFPELATFVAM